MAQRTGGRLQGVGSIVVAIVAIGALALVSCGEGRGAGSPFDAGRLGGACPGGEVDLSSLESRLGDAHAPWYEIDAWEVTRGPVDPPSDRTVTATATADPLVDDRSEGEPMEFTAHDQLAEDIDDAVDSGYPVLAWTSVAHTSANYVAFAAAVGADDTVQFLGSCGSRYNEGFASLVERVTPGLSPAAALRLHATSGGDSPFLGNQEDESPPSTEMVLNPETAPAELLDSLEQVSVQFEVPEAWAESSAVVCTKASVGWNDCAMLSAASTARTLTECRSGQACVERTVDGGGVLVLSAYLAADRHLEVWLLPESGDPTGVRGPISAVDVPTPPDGETRRAVVNVRFAGSAATAALVGTFAQVPEGLTVEVTTGIR